MGQVLYTNLHTPKTVFENVVFASAARTATPTSEVYSNANGCGILVRINVTAVGVTPSVVFTIEGWDPAAGAWYTVLASAAVVSVTTVILRVHTALTAAANLVAKDLMPAQWRVTAVHGNGVTITYSVGAITNGSV